MQAVLWTLCADGVNGCILFLNLFAWCHVVKEVGEDGTERPVPENEVCKPFITWPCQDELLIPGVIDAIENGHDCVLDKARQMGATVFITAVFLWYVIFRKNANFEVMSITEDLVDKAGDPKSIFWKIQYIIDGLPPWLTAGLDRTYMRIINRNNDSSIIGLSTTGAKGRGGAVMAVLFDEAAQIRELESLWIGFAEATNCRIANSTPLGPCYYSDLVMDQTTPTIVLPWYNHPKKGRGRRLARDGRTGEQYVTSPFYAERVRRAGGNRKARVIAQELDRDHHAAGSAFFDLWHVARQKHAAIPELMRGSIVYRGPLDLAVFLEALATENTAIARVQDIEFWPDEEGPWLLWCELEQDSLGGIRPTQDQTPVFGIDVSRGMGASESTISVITAEGPLKLARYSNAALNPTEFANEVALAGYWWGGQHRVAYVCPEANGPGVELIRALDRLSYPWVMMRQGGGMSGESQAGAKMGWWSDQRTKRLLLSEYRQALNTDLFVNPDKRALEQAERYVEMENGEIGNGTLEVESAAVRASHGDLVIADALARYGVRDLGGVQPKARRPARGSIAYERMLDERERQRKKPSRFARTRRLG